MKNFFFCVITVSERITRELMNDDDDDDDDE